MSLHIKFVFLCAIAVITVCVLPALCWAAIGGAGAVGGDYGSGGGGGGSSGVGGAGAAGKQGIIAITYTPPSGSAPAWTGGKRGRALDFDGTGSYITAGNVGSNIKTIAFWMKADDTTSRKIINIDGTDQIELNGSSEVVATSFPAATVYVDASTASAVVDTGWHFVVITDSTGVSASTFEIGRVASSYFDGKIDEVRTYTRALSAAEIAKLYQSGAVKFTTSSVALQQGSSVASGLVGHWTFDGPDVTTTVTDRSGQANNGYFVGGATSSAKTIGHLGQALNFDGTNDYVNVPDNVLYAFGTGDFATSYWQKFTNTGTPRYQVPLDGGYSSNAGVLIETDDVSKLIRVYLGTTLAGTWSWNFIADTWYNVVVTRTGNQLSVFVNGSQLGSPSTNSTSVAHQGYLIGKYSGGEWVNGLLDDVRIYNRALTANEVKQLYNLGTATIKQ